MGAGAGGDEPVDNGQGKPAAGGPTQGPAWLADATGRHEYRYDDGTDAQLCHALP